MLHVPRHWTMPLVLAAAVSAGGCERATEQPRPQAATTTPQPATPLPAAAPANPVKEISVRVDASGRKWLTPTVPYDVFPDLPPDEEIAAGATAKAGSTANSASDNPPSETVASIDRKPSEPVMPDAAPTPKRPSASQPAAAASDWDAVFPREVLQTELASLRNAVGEGLLTVGSYNNAFEQISTDGWVLSALATIASEHPDATSWKANALLARDMATGLAMAATARGRQNFSEAEVAKERLFAVLNNNTPPGLPDPDPAASREETADRAALMTRMQRAADRLKNLIGDEATFKKDAAVASHEAHVLAALAKFTSHRDYGSTDEADYQSAAATVVEGGVGMAKAADGQDFATFKAEFDRVGTACDQCHQKYRFEN
ncbi:MAG: cytochrome c [Planctomycetota bacterium]|nr:cytochrome c [Planctomycetota bacterium]